MREKRGLTYGVETYLLAYDHAGVLAGGLATRPTSREAMKVIDGELHRMATDGPSAEELAAAKRFLIGSYPLRFDSSSAIAGQLLGIQLDGLGIDYVNKRNGLIEAVTLDDVKRVAKRLLDHGAPTVVSVTPPKGVSGGNTTASSFSRVRGEGGPTGPDEGSLRFPSCGVTY